MTQRFIIIDNRDHLIANTIERLLSLKVDRQNIWPPDDESATTSWDQAFRTIHTLRHKGWDPNVDECFVLLDLALDNDQQGFLEGIQQIKYNQPLLKDYITIALTVFSGQAERDLRAEGLVDEVVERFQTHGQSGSELLELAIRNGSRRWAQRTGRTDAKQTSAFMEDSPGIRALQAALSHVLIDQLLQQIAASWNDVTVNSLTGGYSGSHIIRVQGTEGTNQRSVIAKVSRSKKTLQDESERAKRMLQSYKSFVGRVAPFIDVEPRHLGVNEAWYAIQSDVPGRTLEQIVVDAVVGEVAAQEDLADVLSEVTALCQAVPSASVSRDLACTTLRMLDIDLARFEASSRALADLATQCKQRGFFHDLTPERLMEFKTQVVELWNARIESEGFAKLPQFEQHGDFNPRNLLLFERRLQLIDFGRFDMWPIGYDLTRLELQLLLRATDRHAAEDEFADRLPAWRHLWVSIENGSASGEPLSEAHARLFNAIKMIQAIRRDLFARLAPDVDETHYEWLVATMRCFDAVKMCSYQDASIMKRLWFLDIAMRSAALITRQDVMAPI